MAHSQRSKHQTQCLLLPRLGSCARRPLSQPEQEGGHGKMSGGSPTSNIFAAARRRSRP
jgi:hypothetical protein